DPASHPACLGTGPGHKYPLTEQRSFLHPLQRLPQANDFAHDDNSRRQQSGFPDFLCDIRQLANEGLLFSSRTPTNDGNRRLWIPAMTDKLFTDHIDSRYTHKENKRIRCMGDMLPSEGGYELVRFLM